MNHKQTASLLGKCFLLSDHMEFSSAWCTPENWPYPTTAPAPTDGFQHKSCEPEWPLDPGPLLRLAFFVGLHGKGHVSYALIPLKYDHPWLSAINQHQHYLHRYEKMAKERRGSAETKIAHRETVTIPDFSSWYQYKRNVHYYKPDIPPLLEGSGVTCILIGW